ncbi:orotate phosphoribosyltransferase [Buchnera aphidicola (Pemphigus obesinymphae)]|uniref:orotate phosphoribosyltransferase n=1 Tax=Buchnera aphidicola TaxID=9 RepID=UPI002238A51E|nr:orotate phosphoribosyltransferase [Buchnera aphidicola]MCW5196452.1 orotate phosphoribosyltransferase [Buchnera aphidicola (Pemphigus obesinymphae)]
MINWKQEFIKFSLKKKVLQFGDFKLKSGRKSPYFFNSGLFYTGKDISKLGKFYAHAIVESKIQCDVLYGLAYKGIPIVTSTSLSLNRDYNINLPFCFNRKKIKKYGEGGTLIGHTFKKNIIIIDDVITVGTAIKNSMKHIQQKSDITISAIIVALDRQEIDNENYSAVKEIENLYNCKVISIINIQDLINYLSEKKDMKYNLDKLYDYRIKYGINQKEFF